MDILTTAAESYMNTFKGFIAQFTEWGQWLFLSLVTINIVWICLWYAFDKNSISEGMPDFIRKFFVITLFYTIMMNPEWLMQILKTTQFMGNTLTGLPIDPSSLISAGIGLGNKIMAPIGQSSLLTAGFSLIILSLVYIFILFVFISIALDLAVTLIVTTALISAASFFLGFAALGSTSQIARQTLDVILGNCVKLLAMYLVVAAGSKTMADIALTIPANVIDLVIGGLDPYAWIIATAALFWLTSKIIPSQFARIITGGIQEIRGLNAVALSIAALKLVSSHSPSSQVSKAASSIATVLGSGDHSAAYFQQKPGDNVNGAMGLSNKAMASTNNSNPSTNSNVSDHFKQIASKLADGADSQQSKSGLPEKANNSLNNTVNDINAKPSTKPNSTPTGPSRSK